MNTPLSKIEFSLPPALEASAPPEARGLRRDQVRLMVSNYSTDHVEHTRFYQFHKFMKGMCLSSIPAERGILPCSQHEPMARFWNCISLSTLITIFGR